VGQRDAENTHSRRDLAAQKVLQRRRRALVRHMGEIKVRGTRQHHAGEMQHRSGARRPIRRELRVRFAPLDEIRERLHLTRHQRPDAEHERKGAYRRDRGEVLHRVVTERLIDADKARSSTPD
jgi:hypothetical protein